MSKRPGKGGTRHEENGDDDSELWARAAQSISPLKKSKPRVQPAPAEKDRKSEGTPPRAAEVVPPKVKPSVPPARAPAAAANKAAPPIAEFDRSKAKRLRSGRAEIEARIDLHGMRQDEAHAALCAFLHRSRARGLRLVLVITGKGRKEDDDREEPFDMSRNRDRGVLKRNVPRWLEEPELRAIVVSYTTAAIPHGGEGALYVHLRKPQ